MDSLNQDRNKALTGQAEAITSTLNAEGIEPVFLKGMALHLQGVYPNDACRFMRDIDILVSLDQLERASAALQRTGYVHKQRELDDPHDGDQLVHPDLTAMVEIHRSPLPDYLDEVIPVSRVLQNRISAPGLSGTAHTPGPTDLVLHNAAHAMLHDQHYRLAELPLKDAYDIALLATHYGDQIDWAEVEAQMALGGGSSSVWAFYSNATRVVFGADAVPRQRETLGSSLTSWRWRRRKGQPLDMADAREDLQSPREIAWRCLVAPGDRRRIARSLRDAIMHSAIPSRIARAAQRLTQRSS